MSPPHGYLVLFKVFIGANPNLDILGLKFHCKLTYLRRPCAWHCFPSLSEIDILRLVKRIFVDTSVLLRCYFAFVLPILEYCSSVWGPAAECHLQLHLQPGVFGGQALSDQSFLSLCHRWLVVGLSMLVVCLVNH